jgi:hypothetical protein
MNKTLFILLFFIGFEAVSAQNVNEYKYVIVPDAFEFSKGEDQFQLNSLTEFLFEKFGFEAFMKSKEKPLDLQKDNCLGLKANVIENSGLFVTKLVVQLEDCRGNMIFESKEGSSREKDYKTGHHEALRDAFASVEALNYTYMPAEVATTAPETKKTKPEPVEKSEIPSSVPREEKSAEGKNATPAEVEVQNPMINKEFREAKREETKLANKETLNFEKGEQTFSLKKTSNGFSLFQQGGTEPIAVLVTSSDKSSYIYKSLTRQGVAHFDDGGNLIVEYLNNETNKPVTITYSFLGN